MADAEHRGPPGVHGDRGAQGAQGVPGISSTRRLLVMFIFVTAVFILLAWRSEVNDRNIQNNSDAIAESEADRRYQGCLNGQRFVVKYNRLLLKIAKSEDRLVTASTTDEIRLIRAQRAQMYRDATWPEITCTPLEILQ